MIQLISQIFQDSDFVFDEQLTIEPYEYYTSLFAKRVRNDKFDFYLILSVKEENLNLKKLEKNMNETLEQLLQTQMYPGLDKNLSLLLIVERETTTYTDEFNRKVYDLEEDPFYFKKYVLSFTVEQLDLLKKNLSSRDKIVEQLDIIVSKKDWFSDFKEEGKINKSEKAKVYDLITKIYIKLPFIKLKVNREELHNITEEIEDELLDKDKEVVRKILEGGNPEWEEILKVLEVELDEF